jgi:branched-subunit amino acid transport protein
VIWLVVAVVGAATIAFKASGPVLLGGRTLPPRVEGVVDVLAPAMLAALVVTQTVGGDELVLDERLVGVAAGGLAILLRAPLVVVMTVAAVAAALVRLV